MHDAVVLAAEIIALGEDADHVDGFIRIFQQLRRGYISFTIRIGVEQFGHGSKVGTEFGDLLWCHILDGEEIHQ